MAYMPGLLRWSTGSSSLLKEPRTPTATKRFQCNKVGSKKICKILKSKCWPAPILLRIAGDWRLPYWWGLTYSRGDPAKWTELQAARSPFTRTEEAFTILLHCMRRLWDKHQLPDLQWRVGAVPPSDWGAGGPCLLAESCRDTSHGRMEIQQQAVIRTALQHHQHNNSWLQFAISDKVIILSSHYIHYTTNISIFSSACAIELENHVVVTGGILFLSAIPTVQVYNISGPRFVLPNLQTSRYNHACAYYFDSKDRVVSICIRDNGDGHRE